MNSTNERTHFIGIMSGTSVDAVDAVVLRIDGMRSRVLTSCSLPIPPDVRDEALDLIRSDRDSLNRAYRLANQLTSLYAAAITQLLESFPRDEIEAVGCHGQTLRHFPDDAQTPFTIQAVNGAMLATVSGLPCVTDFRSADLALGGQGAPLAPAFHADCFRSSEADRIILNLGGIANITILPSRSGIPVAGFDTGPANALMDLWSQRHTGARFDRNGEFAARGLCNPELRDRMLLDEYFHRPAPKSTGREYFGWQWLEKHLESFADVGCEDVQATLLEVTAQSIANAILQAQPSTREVYACGGGYRNGHLMKRIQVLLGDIRLTTTAELGITPEQVEAAAFAWLAQRRLRKLPGNLPSVTGASRAAILGALYIP